MEEGYGISLKAEAESLKPKSILAKVISINKMINALPNFNFLTRHIQIENLVLCFRLYALSFELIPDYNHTAPALQFFSRPNNPYW
jgi:hypothetical protein